MTDGRPHWGAIAFAIIFGLIAFALVLGPLFDALPPVDRAAVRSAAAPTNSDRTPLVGELSGRWHTQPPPIIIAVGAEVEVDMQLQNLGQVPWIKGSPSELRLGEVGSSPLPAEMRDDWPYSDRPAVQGEVVVYPGQRATFAFTVKGSAQGTYQLHVQPVVDGVAWLSGAEVTVEITVR